MHLVNLDYLVINSTKFNVHIKHRQTHSSSDCAINNILSQCALRIAELESQHWPHVQIRPSVAWHGAYLPPIDIE